MPLPLSRLAAGTDETESAVSRRRLHRQRVVCLGNVADLLDLGELRVRPPARKGVRPRGDLVGVEHPFEAFAARPEVADLERGVRVELPLDVEHVLNHVRRLAVVHVAVGVVILHADERRLHAADVAARSEERRVPVEIQQQRVGDILPAADGVARHVESWIPRVCM